MDFQPLLPPGWKISNATANDLQRVTDYQIAFDIAVFGKPDTTLSDVEYEWSREGFQVDRDAWIIENPDGKLAGYADYWENGEELYIDHLSSIHPNFRSQINQEILYQMAQPIASAFGRTAIQKLRTISVEPYSEDILANLGFQAIQTQWRMVYALGQQIDEPTCPKGYQLVPFQRENHARQVYDVIETAFTELPHREGNTFEGWQKFILDRSDFSPNFLKVVMTGPEVAAVAVGFDNEIGGWIRQLAVKKAHRGKGLASFLLRRLFFEFARQGRSDVGLTVDSENRTGAPELYLRAGMKPTEKYVTFIKELEKYS